MLESYSFWQYLNFTQKELIKQSFYLLDWAKKNEYRFHDYSFIVMPAAKAFEGFLKQILFDLRFISRHQFYNDYFRIGKALNPELEKVKELRKECLYDEIAGKCGINTAKTLWQTWKQCRNRLFHYFPQEQQVFTLAEAEGRLNNLIEAMETVYHQYKVSDPKNSN